MLDQSDLTNPETAEQAIQSMLPSELLSLALADMRRCETDPAVMIDMGVWIEPDDDGCVVCMAGSVMLKTLAFKPEILDYTDIREHILMPQFSALDFLREGHIDNALRVLGRKIPPALEDLKVAVPQHKEDDPEPFHGAMADIITMLKNEGL